MHHIYSNLLLDLASAINLDSADQFIKTEELVINGVVISLYYESNDRDGEIVFFSLLGRPDESHMSQILQALLKANYLWSGTGGATLGMSSKDQQIICAQRLPLGTLTAESLAPILVSFANTASFWTRWMVAEANKSSFPKIDELSYMSPDWNL